MLEAVNWAWLYPQMNNFISQASEIYWFGILLLWIRVQIYSNMSLNPRAFCIERQIFYPILHNNHQQKAPEFHISRVMQRVFAVIYTQSRERESLCVTLHHRAIWIQSSSDFNDLLCVYVQLYHPLLLLHTPLRQP